MMKQSSFNIVHLAIALLILMVLVALLLPALKASQHRERRLASSNPLRGIHQGLITYANSNNQYFVGLNPDGSTHDLTVEYRFKTLIENDYFTPFYAVSPSEDYNNPIAEWDKESPFTKDHYSYAMLQVPEKDNGRRGEWRQTLKSQAIVMSDRNTGTASKPASIYREYGGVSKWQVLWNDNHIGFEDSYRFETKYGNGSLNKNDHLFKADSLHDALMLHSGNDKD